MSGVPVQACVACGHAVFPARVLCPRCGCRDWTLVQATAGTVEQVTTRRSGGHVASVATDPGPIVIASCPEGISPGARVVLTMTGGAPAALAG